MSRGKFVRRHMLRLATTALLLLVIAFAATTVGMWRQADRERILKNDFVEFLDLLFLYSTSDVTGGDELQTLAILDRVEEKLEELDVELPFQAEVLESMSRIYVERGLYEEARVPLERALQIRRQLEPQGGPKRARALSNLAGQYFHLGNYDKAERLYREALTMKREFTQEEVDIAKTISNLATIRLSRGDFNEAEELGRMALDIRKDAYGPEDADVATNLRNLGNLLYLQGDYEGAEPLLREAMGIRRAVFGPEDKRVATVLSNLGRVLHARGRHLEAKEQFIRCLAIRRKRLGDGHPYVAYTRRDLAALLVDYGRFGNSRRVAESGDRNAAADRRGRLLAARRD